MSSNRSYFSNFLAAFKAHQPTSSYLQTVPSASSTAANHTSFSGPHRQQSPGSTTSKTATEDPLLSPSPFEHLTDSTTTEWSPSAEVSRFKHSTPRSQPKTPRRQVSPGVSSPINGDIHGYPSYQVPTVNSRTAVPSQYALSPPSKRSLSKSPPSKAEFAYSPTSVAPVPVPSVQASTVRYHVTHQSALPAHSTSLHGNRSRRGSDSSNEGFRDVGSERWYVAGANSNGDERFYRLGVIKRPRSVDRLSMDQMSI